MLHGLETQERLKLESYAREYALEADTFYHLYPEVIDKKAMSAMRVEAQLRRSANNDVVR